MKFRKQRTMLLLCYLLMGLSGCAAVIAAGVGVGVGFGTYKYLEGNLQRDYIGPPDTLWEATLTALDDLQVAAEVKERDFFGGLIKGIMHDGTKITINMKRLTDNSTEVGVRVGVFGDRKRSETIHNKIAENFKKT
ncbi:MAG: DUF3568 family protein [Syntrophobacterales bacterium]